MGRVFCFDGINKSVPIPATAKKACQSGLVGCGVTGVPIPRGGPMPPGGKATLRGPRSQLDGLVTIAGLLEGCISTLQIPVILIGFLGHRHARLLGVRQ